ncbi:hypothetical protein [Streptomyces sp. NPDC001851]|uniref:hypothetical protein n=1 Tax=Streptomyces sp. NPDC001851 TaxID=3154529 RepID=UPI00332E46BA
MGADRRHGRGWRRGPISSLRPYAPADQTAVLDLINADRCPASPPQPPPTQIIEAKREQKPLAEAPEPEQSAQVLDLVAALQESVSKAKAARGEDTGPGEVHELPKPK